MVVVIVMEMVQEEIVLLQEGAVIEAFNQEVVTLVHVNLEAMLMLQFLLEI